MKLLAGSSVVTRHCRAKPCVTTLSWSPRPISGSDSGRPWAIRIWHLDHVEAGDLLGDGVLDLDARIDLDEVELAACRRRPGTRRCRRCRAARPGRRRGRRRGCAGGWPGRGSGPGRSRRSSDGGAAREQSRSKRWTRLPCWSPRSCTSMCRARAMNFSRKTSATAEGGAGLAAGLVEGLVELRRRCGRRACPGRRRPSPP